MDGGYGEPEEAICCYERWSGLAVTVHDVAAGIEAFLAPGRGMHGTPACQAFKRSPLGGVCMHWDAVRTRAEIAELPRGRVQRCHAGLVEAVVPVLRGDRLALVLFAGQRSAGPGLRPVQAPDPASPWPAKTARPPAWTADEAAHALEGLRQLGARLHGWLDDAFGAPGDAAPASAALVAPADRARAIRAFILHEHHRPLALADLARHLGLSPARAAHVVRAACGRTFIDLLTEARLRSACALLRHTDLAVPEAAGRAGFGDPDHFHRVFRRRLRTTPGAYRRAGATGEP